MAVDMSKRPPLAELVARREFGIVTYGMTPPKVGTDEEKLATTAATQTERLRGLPVDAVVMYDIHDEKDRETELPRPFPFADTHDGLWWARERLGKLEVPFVHFRCIAKYTKPTWEDQMTKLANSQDAAVIVGAAASSQQVEVDMATAYAIKKELAPQVLLGAVSIPERHAKKGDEHLRMWKKQTEGGVNFFITQCVYNLEEAKNMLSDYALQCKKNGEPMAPVCVTLTPCGSAKTLEFLRWLGVKVSKWLENDLLNTKREGGILEESVEALLHMFRDLAAFAVRHSIPLGCNVESVAIRKAEIEAAGRMVGEVHKILAEAKSKYEPYTPATTGTPQPVIPA